MSAKSHSFTVGEAACTVLLDGASLMGREGVLRRFPNGTEAEYRQAYADIGLSLDEAESCFNILVAKIGAETVLVDTGQAGRPNGGWLPESLRLAGLTPEAITLVVITHAHGDHVLGLVAEDGTPAFPNTRYAISKTEMDGWRKRVEENLPDHRPLIAMLEARDVRLIDGEAQVVPGLTAVPIPGHTPGQMALVIESGQEKLIHLADLLHTPMQFAHPEWSPSFDADPVLSVSTRRGILGRAADENMLAMFYHLPFPGLGRVSRDGASFTWQPVVL